MKLSFIIVFLTICLLVHPFPSFQEEILEVKLKNTFPQASQSGYILKFVGEPVLSYKKGLELDIKQKKEALNSQSFIYRNTLGLFEKIKIARSEREIPSKVFEYHKEIQERHSKFLSSLGKMPRVLGNFEIAFNGIALDIDQKEAENIAAISRDIEAIYPNRLFKIDLNESIYLIKADQVWQKKDEMGRNLMGQGIKVAVIDTGVDYTHPDLGGCFGPGCKVEGGYDFVTCNSYDDFGRCLQPKQPDGDPMDDNGHGTHCAGIISSFDRTPSSLGQFYKGVAPESKIYAYKVLNRVGVGSDAEILSALEQAVRDKVDVISMSLGTQCSYSDLCGSLSYCSECGPDDVLSQTVDSIVDSGIVVVVAAGNCGPGGNPSNCPTLGSRTIGSPGTSRKAITVGASCKQDDAGPSGYEARLKCIEGSIGYFSSRGPVITGVDKPDVVAPGVNIISTYPCSLVDYPNSCSYSWYARMSGTSMAAPHVAGLAALLKQKNPSLSPSQIKEIIKNTADSPFQGYSYTYEIMGKGQINALSAVNYLDSAITSTTTLTLTTTTKISTTTTLTPTTTTLTTTTTKITTSTTTTTIAFPTTYSKNVFLIIYNPIIESQNNRKLTDVMRWNDPDQLTRQYIEDIRDVSHGMVNYVISQRIELDEFPKKIDGFQYTDETYLDCVYRGTCHSPDGVDYLKILNDYDVCGKLNRGEIHELWLFGGPWFGYYESRLAGNGAFYCNSPPLGGTTCNKILPIMGFNYERGVAEMLENLGHRSEDTVGYAYGGWDVTQSRHDFDRFGHNRGQTPNVDYYQCGTVHYAPNSIADYDWGNRDYVPSNCDDWYNYPNFKGVIKQINCQEWNCDARQHKKWWFSHFPAMWWSYIINFDFTSTPTKSTTTTSTTTVSSTTTKSTTTVSTTTRLSITTTTIMSCPYNCWNECADDKNPEGGCYDRTSYGGEGCPVGLWCCQSQRECCGTVTECGQYWGGCEDCTKKPNPCEPGKCPTWSCIGTWPWTSCSYTCGNCPITTTTQIPITTLIPTTTTTIISNGFVVSNFDCNTITEGYICRLRYENNLMENALVVFILADSKGKVVNSAVPYASKTANKASCLIFCENLIPGNYYLNYKIFRESDLELSSPILWSNSFEVKTLIC